MSPSEYKELIDFLGPKLDAFREQVHDGFAEVRAEMKAGFDAIHARVDRLEAA